MGKGFVQICCRKVSENEVQGKASFICALVNCTGQDNQTNSKYMIEEILKIEDPVQAIIELDSKLNESKRTTHRPTQKDLIFAPPTFFCFSATAQLAHLVLPDTPAYASQTQKSQFLALAK